MARRCWRQRARTCWIKERGKLTVKTALACRHRPQHQIVLCLEMVTISLATRHTLALHQSRQDGVGGLLLLQHPDRHIDSLCLCYQRGSGHYDVRLLCYMSYCQRFSFCFLCGLCSGITRENPNLSFVYVALHRYKPHKTEPFLSSSRYKGVTGALRVVTNGPGRKGNGRSMMIRGGL